jgi:hypothetical protein
MAKALSKVSGLFGVFFDSLSENRRSVSSFRTLANQARANGFEETPHRHAGFRHGHEWLELGATFVQVARERRAWLPARVVIFGGYCAKTFKQGIDSGSHGGRRLRWRRRMFQH